MTSNRQSSNGKLRACVLCAQKPCEAAGQLGNPAATPQAMDKAEEVYLLYDDMTMPSSHAVRSQQNLKPPK